MVGKNGGCAAPEKVRRQLEIVATAEKGQGCTRCLFTGTDKGGPDDWVRRVIGDSLDESYLTSYLHPIFSFSAAGSELFGYEALIRAHDPCTGALIGAGSLLDASERLGLQHIFDQRARQTAIRTAATLPDSGRVFINFLPSTIYNPRICLQTTLAAALRFRICFERLVFEVVETERIPDISYLQRILDYYREQGAATAVDDMGAGHTSIRYITALRPDFVKIDREIVQKAVHRVEVRARLATLIAATKAVGAQCIVEGIETEEEAELCLYLGATLLQGFLFAHPANPPEAVNQSALTRLGKQYAPTEVRRCG